MIYQKLTSIIILCCLLLLSKSLFANQPPVVDVVNYSPSSVVNPGEQVVITVTAHDPDCNGSCTSGCGTYIRYDLTQWSVTDPQGNITQLTSGVDRGTSGSPYTTTLTWTAPPVTGGYTFHVSLSDSGSFLCGGRQTTVHDIPLSVAVGNPPVITSIVSEKNEIFINRKTLITATAYDPDGDPITYEWTSSGGTISPTDLPYKVEWIAPPVGGVYTVTVKVMDINGLSAMRSTTITVVVAVYKNSITSNLESPGRIAVDPDGNIYVTDQRKDELLSYTPLGLLRFRVQFQEVPLGIAVDDTDSIFVGGGESGSVYIFDRYGRFVKFLGGPGEFQSPADIAVDNALKRIYVADSKGGRVKIFDYSGNKIKEINIERFPVGVSVDPSSGDFVVVCGAGSNTDNYIFVYSQDGVLKKSFSGYASSPSAGKNVRAGGLSVDINRNIYVADTYLGWVQAIDSDGGHIAYIGGYGGGGGLMRNPADVTIDRFGQLLVADADNGRIDIFEFATASPKSCTGDRDCDGIPDSWELTYGLNPEDPSDAFQDLDGDGLVNLEEFLAGTDPTNPDSDGDGVNDRDELKGGTNPYDDTAIPVSDAGSDMVVNPTLVILDGSKSYDPHGLPLKYHWVQTAGTAVDLQNSDTPKAHFIATKSGEYQFTLIVNNGRTNSLPDSVIVRVNNVPPTADAGVDRTVYIGSSVILDGTLSSDANGDELHYFWTQEDGPKVELLNSNTSRASFVADLPGDYRFSLLVSDGFVESDKAYVNVHVLDPVNLPPYALILPVPGRIVAGTPVVLDGSLSMDPENEPLTYLWEQILGPPIRIEKEKDPVITIVPEEPGLYTFLLKVSDGFYQSSHTVTFVVDGNDAHVPHAFAGFDRFGRVAERLCIDGRGSYDADFDSLTYFWRQIGGTRVDIEQNSPKTCFIPIYPGLYRFGLTVQDSRFVSLEDTVDIFITGGDGSLPIIARQPIKWAGRFENISINLDLDGEFIVEQFSGPHVPIFTESGSFSFVPYSAGTYGFRVFAIFSGRKTFFREFFVVVEDRNHISPVPVVQTSVMSDFRATVTINAGESFSKSNEPMRFLWTQGSGRLALITDPFSSLLNLAPERSGITYNVDFYLNDADMLSYPVNIGISVADKFEATGEIKRTSGGSVSTKEFQLFIPSGGLIEDTLIGIGRIKSKNLYGLPDKWTIEGDGIFIAPEGLNFIEEAVLYFKSNSSDGAIAHLEPSGEWVILEGARVDENNVAINIKESGVYALVKQKGGGNTVVINDARCFIATAAFGDSENFIVKVLRRFRDSILMRSDPGRKFVEVYYRWSPGIAFAIKNSIVLRYLVQLILIPFAFLAYLVLISGPLALPGVLTVGFVTFLGIKLLRRRRS